MYPAGCRGTASLCLLQTQVKLSGLTMGWVASKPCGINSQAVLASRCRKHGATSLLLSTPPEGGVRKSDVKLSSERSFRPRAHGTFTHWSIVPTSDTELLTAAFALLLLSVRPCVKAWLLLTSTKQQAHRDLPRFHSTQTIPIVHLLLAYPFYTLHCGSNPAENRAVKARNAHAHT